MKQNKKFFTQKVWLPSLLLLLFAQKNFYAVEPNKTSSEENKYADYLNNHHNNTDYLHAAQYEPKEKNYEKLAQESKQAGDTKKTIYYYKKALAQNQNNFRIIFDLGTELYADSQYDEAIACFEKAIAIYPKNPQLYFNISLCYMLKEDTDKTIEYLKKSVEIDPTYIKGYNQLGSILHKAKRDEEAINYLKKSVAENPNALNPTFLLARSLRNIDELEEAVYYFKKSLEIKPNDTSILIELANTYNMLNECEEAIACYEQALKNNPNDYIIKYNYGYTLKKIGRVEETIKLYHEVLETKPNYANAQFSLALAYLVIGNFTDGFELYESRWNAYGETKTVRDDKPEWDGSNPDGKTILLCAEQGLGDTFQFVRYAKVLKEMGATVIVQTQKVLSDILQLCPYIDIVVPRGEAIPDFDYYLYLMSMPLMLKTTVDTVPDEIPYLYADPKLIQYWGERLAQDKNFKIGICWQGNKSYRTQALKHAVQAKSMHAQLFKPISEIPGVSLYCLQKMNGEEQLNEIDFEIITFDDDFDNSHGRFMDTAAVMKNLDLIVTIDTSTCHIAAALGVPVWTMLPYPADWRWMLETNKTPWYPNMKLFRQKAPGQWEELIDEIKEEICKIIVHTISKTTDNDIIKASPNHTTQEKKPETNKSAQPSQEKEISTRAKYKEDIQDINNIQDIQDSNETENTFSQIIDKLIILKIIQLEGSTDNTKLETQIEQAERELKDIAKRHNTNSETLDELVEKLYEINSQLLYIDKQIAKLHNSSVLDKEFITLTKRAQYVYNLKEYIKQEIEKSIKK